MVDARRHTVLITGATSGIGYELAKLFAQAGFQLVLTARNEPKLRQVAHELSKSFDVTVKTIAKDLSSATAADEIYQEVKRGLLEVDILVNNAGFGAHGLFSDIPLSREIEMMQLNMISLTVLTKHFLKDMLKRNHGKILNVASTASFLPGPLMAVYYATKAYVLSFSEALSSELQGSGVTVTALCPGSTRTGFQKAAGLKDVKFVQMTMMDPERVAKDGYAALMKGKSLVISGLSNQIMISAVRFLPRNFVTRALKQIQAKKAK